MAVKRIKLRIAKPKREKMPWDSCSECENHIDLKVIDGSFKYQCGYDDVWYAQSHYCDAFIEAVDDPETDAYYRRHDNF